uniref:Uncharacterized protein n=1 Tax=Anguilla anguilla TaxID=7936 RepID=A0A0E9TJ29_ANGAN
MGRELDLWPKCCRFESWVRHCRCALVQGT